MSKMIYFDPMGGVAGDMFTAAFLDAGIVSINELQNAVNMVVPEVKLSLEKDLRCGIEGSRLRVISPAGEEKVSGGHLVMKHHHHHEHHPYKEIRESLKSSGLDMGVKNLALSVFETLAKAEAKIHGKKIEEIIFHEVGRNDAVADIICAAYCVRKMGNAQIVCGPIPLGQGTITFSHGTMPVPAPATLEILKGIPTIPGFPVGEMTTPTGAAIIATCCQTFQQWASISPELIGYGHGSRDPKGYPGSFRIIVGETINNLDGDLDHDEVMELSTNIDDQPPHVLAPALDKLMQEGAIDVFVISYLGKKSRQGQAWTVLVKPEDANRISMIMMRELGTIGIRMVKKERYKLKREVTEIVFDGETIRAKRVFGAGINRIYPEIDDLIKAAERKGISLMKLKDMINAREGIENENVT